MAAGTPLPAVWYEDRLHVATGRAEQKAGLWHSKYHGDWDFAVEDGKFRHGDGGTALVFEVAPTKVLALAEGRFAQTRFRFPRTAGDA